MSEIKFRLIKGEPKCPSEACPIFETCVYVLQGTSMCIPGLRQQRDELKAKLEAVRELADYNPWQHPNECEDRIDSLRSCIREADRRFTAIRAAGKGRESTISPAEVDEILEKSLSAREELRESLEKTFDRPPGFSTLRLKGDKKDPQ